MKKANYNSYKDKTSISKIMTIVAIILGVTIVVLLILAGTTISYMMRDNSVFKKTKNTKLRTELSKIEERANLIYTDKLMKNVLDSLNNKPTMQEIVEQLEVEGYKIKRITASEKPITGISLSRESMILNFEGTNTIKVTLLGQNGGEAHIYYAIVDGKYYEMHSNNGNITINKTASEIEEGDNNTPTLTVSSSDETVATVMLNNDTNVVNVTANNTNKEGTIDVTVTYGSYTKTCSVTVKNVPITTKLEMNSVRARIAAGYTRWLGAMTTPIDALQEFEWSSSNEDIATVDEKGVVTAKKAGITTIKVKTIDGSNKEGACAVTVVENAPDVATLTDFQTENTVAKDINGNLITVPGDFKVLTSEGTKITEGIVIQDREENEFVWVPIDSVSTGTSKVADDIRLGRYEDFTTKNSAGNYIPKQDADNYIEVVTIENYFQEIIENSGNRAAKNLGEFVTKTKEKGGYYLGRYEASQGSDYKVKSQYDKTVWTKIIQPTAAINCQNMYNGNNYIESDLVNSYAWDTAIIFIQKYSENSNYANKISINSSQLNTGKSGDKVCNLYDMASNYSEWTTEHSFETTSVTDCPFVRRGGGYSVKEANAIDRTYHGTPSATNNSYISFRTIFYVK